ncbi:MAG: enamine deaminase RidA (YjgF/YER057c/UK114 family) [Myxococcota bacterium]|jgi:enamine deaminase RidA (YjgF/YER057c/UK114 family)
MSKDFQQFGEVVQPEGWPMPRGYVNGMITRGRLLHVAGQIGWNAAGEFPFTDMVGQFGLALENVLTVIQAAGGQPTDLARLTIYVTDLNAYRQNLRALGAAWRERAGRHYPAMALVGVAGLVEPRALIEMEAVASLPESA